MGLNFFNQTPQLGRWDVTSFCMQLETVSIGNNISESEDIREREGKAKICHFLGVHRGILKLKDWLIGTLTALSQNLLPVLVSYQG